MSLNRKIRELAKNKEIIINKVSFWNAYENQNMLHITADMFNKQPFVNYKVSLSICLKTYKIWRYEIYDFELNGFFELEKFVDAIISDICSKQSIYQAIKNKISEIRARKITK